MSTNFKLTLILALIVPIFPIAAETLSANQLPNEEPFTTDLPCTDSTSLQGIPTYESLGLYLDADSGEARVRYKQVGESVWRAGYPLWYDGRNFVQITNNNNESRFRGSIVHLCPNTAYEVQVLKDSQLYCGTFHTLNDNFPVARTVQIGNLTKPLIITEGGTEDGYVVYEGGSISLGVYHSTGIKVNANYVIIRNTKVSGSVLGIVIEGGKHDVVIEGTEITNWGNFISAEDRARYGASSQYFGSSDEAIVIPSDAYRITVQRNYIHSPRTDSNTWDEMIETQWKCISKQSTRCHPWGPRGINMQSGNQGIQRIIRYNTFAGKRTNMLEDAITGQSNDSDIYGNFITGFVDDAMEIDGFARNSRVWGNHIHVIAPDGSVNAPEFKQPAIFSISPIDVGPVFIWRNLTTIDKGTWIAMLVKKQAKSVRANRTVPVEVEYGRLYFFHNTSLSGRISGSGHPVVGIYAYNNVVRNGIEPGYLDFDFKSNLSGESVPSMLDANFIVKTGTTGVNAGITLPNFNDSYEGSAPDIGYQEAGGSAPVVGYTASYIYGDVTTNDEITAYDAEIALQYSVGISPNEFPTPWAIWRFEISDVDNDNIITANDASLILKHTDGLIESLPVEKNTEAMDDTIISITNEDGFIVFRATGDLFGLNVFVNDNTEYLGTPEILDTIMISETNISANSYAIGIATAYSPKSDDIFMRIPYSGGQNVTITFDMIVNSVNMQVTVDLATGIIEISDNTIFVYPNPANNSLFSTGFNKSTKISIYDSSGRVLINKQVFNNQIDISNFQKGIYTIKIENADGMVTRNFVKQ